MKREISIDCLCYSLKADFYETDSDQIMLALPGYTSTKAKYAGMIDYVVDRTGISALVLDYRGHGESPFDLKDLRRADNFNDVVVAFDWIKTNYPDKKIIVHGTSYGGFHAAYLTKFREFERLLLRVPATYPEESLYTVIGSMNDPHGGRYRFEPQNYTDHWLFTHTQSVKNDTFVVTHQYDDVCPPVSTQPFVDAFNAKHWEAPGFKHGFSESDATDDLLEQYYQKIADWILE